MSTDHTSSDAPAADVRCSYCGAALTPGSARCWLCNTEFSHANSAGNAATPQLAAEAARPAGKVAFSISTLLLATTLAAIVAALVAEVPGLGIPVCILLAPVLVRTAMVVRRREAAGRRVFMGQKVGLILTSFVVATIILAVVGVAAVGSFCAVCLGSVSVVDGNNAIVSASLAALTVSGGLLFLMFSWVRARYRRDIS